MDGRDAVALALEGDLGFMTGGLGHGGWGTALPHLVEGLGVCRLREHGYAEVRALIGRESGGRKRDEGIVTVGWHWKLGLRLGLSDPACAGRCV